MTTFEIVLLDYMVMNFLLEVAEVIRPLMSPGSISIWTLCVFALSNYSVITSGMLMTLAAQHKEVRETTLIFSDTELPNFILTPPSNSFNCVTMS